MCTNIQNSQDKEQRKRRGGEEYVISVPERVSEQKWKKKLPYINKSMLLLMIIILCHNQPAVYIAALKLDQLLTVHYIVTAVVMWC